MTEQPATASALSDEDSDSRQPQSRTEMANDIRFDLLKMEGAGFSKTEIVKHLAEKYRVTPRAIHYHFQKRSHWQPRLQNQQDMTLKIINCLWQVYREASYKFKTEGNPNSQAAFQRNQILVLDKLTEICCVEQLSHDIEVIKREVGLKL